MQLNVAEVYMKTAVMIGDSHSQIVFPLLKEKLPFQFDAVVSKPGWGIRKFMQENIIPSLPNAEICIVGLGGNNMNTDSVSYGAELASFLDLLKSKYKRIVWIGPYFSDEESVNKRHYWTNAFLKVALPSNIGYIDVYDISKPISRQDGVHSNRSGYETIVSQILPRLEQLSTASSFVLWLKQPHVILSVGIAVASFVIGVVLDPLEKKG